MKNRSTKVSRKLAYDRHLQEIDEALAQSDYKIRALESREKALKAQWVQRFITRGFTKEEAQRKVEKIFSEGYKPRKLSLYDRWYLFLERCKCRIIHWMDKLTEYQTRLKNG